MKRGRLAIVAAVLAGAAAVAAATLWRGTGGADGAGAIPDRAGAGPSGGAGRDAVGLATPPRGVPPAAGPKGRCRLEGQVLRARAPSAAEIELRWSATPPYFEADEREFVVRLPRDPDAPVVWCGRAGDDGRFGADGLPAGRWDVSAVAADGARGESTLLAAVDGVREVVALTLLAAKETLRGQVLGEDGRPAAGRLLAADRPVDVRADGTFEVHDLCAGPVDLQAEGPDGTRADVVVRLPRARPVTLRLRRPAGERVVRVLASPGATPIEGAEVRALGWRGPVARTDREGRARVPLGDGRFLEFAAEGYATVTTFAGQRGATEELVVRLRKAARVEGRVRSAADGRALEGVLVEASGGDVRVSVPAASAVSAADGAYVLEDLAPGPWTIVARGRASIVRGLASMPADDDYGSIRRERLECDPLLVDVPPGTTTLDLEMVPGAVLRGRVLDASGSPVAGAEVVLYAPRAPSLGGRLDPVYWERYAAATDADGRYEFAALIPGRFYEAWASASGVAARGETRAPAEGGATILDFRLPPSLSLDVRVVEAATGLGLPGISVGATGRYGTPAGRATVTGEEGWARLVPVPGDAEKVWARGHGDPAAVEQAVDLSTGAPPAPLVLRLPAAGAEDEGSAEAARTGTASEWAEFARHLQPLEHEDTHDGARERVGLPFTVVVLDALGAPVPEADLVWWDSGDWGETEARVTAGTVRIQVPASVADRLWVEVRRPRDREGMDLPLGPARAGPFDVKAGRAEVRLPAERTIDGRVVGPDGRGVRGLLLHAVEVDWATKVRTSVREYAEAHTDGAGAFRLRGLAAGPHYVTFAVPSEFAPVPPSVHEAGERGVEFRLRPCEVVSVRMVDPAGQPVAGASVFVAGVPYRAPPRLPQDIWSGPRQGAESGADGIARLVGMSREVQCQLRATPPPGREDLEPLEIDAWVPSTGDLAFPGLAAVRGIVRSGEGAPIPGAHIEALRGRTWEEVGKAGRDGAFVVRVPATGRTQVRSAVYEVERGDPDGTYWGERTAYRSEPVEVEPGASDVALVVERGADLTVRVAYPAGRVGWGSGRTYEGVLLDEASAGQGRPFAGLAGSVGGVGGVYRFHQLRSDRRYTFWLSPDVAGSYVLARGLRPAKVGAEVSVDAVRGRPVKGRILGLPQVGRTLVFAQQGTLGVYLESEPDGRFEFPGLPEGAWRLNVDVHRDDAVWSGEAVVIAGDGTDVAIELRASETGR